MSEEGSGRALRFTVDEHPPHGLALMLGLQTVALILTGIILLPIIVLTAAGRPEGIAWAVFAALLVSGLATMLQARPVGAFGSGYPLYMGTSGAFLAVCTSAAALGGLPLLASLVIVSAAVQFFFAARLSLFRRIVTPTVGGAVVLLIAVNVFPLCTDMLGRTPAGVDPSSLAAPAAALAAFVTIVAVSLYASGALQLWAPLLGVLAGCLAAAPLGLLDWSPVADAAWFGLPAAGWPGIDLNFDARFFGLLPSFVIVTVIGAIETYGDAIAIQRVSHRDAPPVNFKAVQGAVNADGVGNLLAGLAGTLPNTTYATSISVADLTGVAARRVALYGGLIIVAVAFLPKVSALLRVVPDPVAGAYLLILIVLLFRQGLRLVTTGGLSYEKGLIVCLSFWLGIGFQNGQIFPDHLPAWSVGLLDNGMTAGGLVAIVLTFLVSLRHRAGRERLPPSAAAITKLRGILDDAAAAAGWDPAATDRLQLAGEEAFVYLLDRQADAPAPHPIGLAVRHPGDALELEFASGPESENLEARLHGLGAEAAAIDDAGLRILRHMAREVKHEQFRELDVLTVTVDSRPLR